MGARVMSTMREIAVDNSVYIDGITGGQYMRARLERYIWRLIHKRCLDSSLDVDAIGLGACGDVCVEYALGEQGRVYASPGESERS